MQAGTTGINANRIYSPAKQAADHAGPDFAFIRRWVPELAQVPTEFMAEPHRMPSAIQERSGCIIGQHYPPPIVDGAQSYRHATSEFARVKAKAETKAQAAAVYEQHGSRKRPQRESAASGKRPALQAGDASDADDGPKPPEADLPPLPFTTEQAASGRATCRACGGTIARNSTKACVGAWARGSRITASHHLECFVRSWRVEACASNRGKCKHSGRAFVKGSPRVGFATTAISEVAWICLESAKLLFPPLLQSCAAWECKDLKGFDELPTDELRAEVVDALHSR